MKFKINSLELNIKYENKGIKIIKTIRNIFSNLLFFISKAYFLIVKNFNKISINEKIKKISELLIIL